MLSGAGHGGHHQQRGFLEAGPRSNDFLKANVSEMLAFGSWHGPSARTAEGKSPKHRRCRMLQPPCIWGFSFCSPGLPATHSLPGEPSGGQTDGCSPHSRAQRDRNMPRLFFSLSSSIYFANDPFPPFTPNYTSIGSTTKAVRTQSGSGCDRKGWGPGGRGQGGPSTPAPAPSGPDPGKQPLGCLSFPTIACRARAEFAALPPASTSQGNSQG